MTIADSQALRARRARAHKRGDHSLCTRCAVALGRRDGPEGQEIPPSPPGGMPEVLDAQAEMRRLAGRLVEAYRIDSGNAALAKELRLTLQALMGGGKGSGDDDLADLFAELGSA